MAEYSRPADAFRFKFGGLKTNSSPDALSTDKYPYVQNIRADSDDFITTRPGVTQKFTITGPNDTYATDLRAYTAIGTDNSPRILARGNSDGVYLDNSVRVGSLFTTSPRSPGASMITFRPPQSPNPYMYIANGTDYQKFSAPSATNVVSQAKVGIQEPQASPDAATGVPPVGQSLSLQLAYLLPSGTWGHAGTAGVVSAGTRTTDTITTVFIDLAQSNDSILQVSNTHYTPFEVLFLNGNDANYLEVQEVLPAIPTALSIVSICYFSDSAPGGSGTGRCVVVPKQLSPGADVEANAVFSTELVATLRRGSVVQIGSEICMVTSTAMGPNGQISFETSTVSNHNTGETLSGLYAIRVANPLGLVLAPLQTLVSKDWTWQVTAGIGTITEAVSPNLFSVNGVAFGPDDYIHFSINVDNLANLTELKLLLDVGDGTFTKNFYYMTVRPSDIQGGIANTLTQIGVAQFVTQRAVIDQEKAVAAAGQGQTSSSAQTVPGSQQWSEIAVPIRALTRVGSNQQLTLTDNNAMQVLVNASGTVNLALSSVSVRGGGSADVGPTGAPYLYRVRPRSSVTGAKGNPSPATRYGVSPRRRAVIVVPPAAPVDAQIDTWDIFRYGGTVTSWRKIGQCVAGVPNTFTDNYPDDAASAGEPLDFDNYEPWPTIDTPLSGNSVICGTFLFMTYGTQRPTVANYLPGNLIQVANGQTYTLRSRPIILPGFISARFELIENAGANLLSFPHAAIYEPAVANAHLPYMWGPDATGTNFAVGDPSRPGNLYFSKPNDLDSAPDKFNIEITPPSEPLIGGEDLDGLSYVASSERWWALYPQFSNPLQRYSVIQQPIPRGLAAPWGHCSDGKTIYWWAKDGIWSSSKGSLTDGDLFDLFPHDGVAGSDQPYLGFTVHAPDYSRAGTFRLSYCNGYLRATYQDSTAAFRMLIYDTVRGAWSIDDYGLKTVSTSYHVEQPAGTLLSSTALYPQLLTAHTTGQVGSESPMTNDIGTPIFGAICTAEWGAGDIRADEQWGDCVLGCTPASGITVTTNSDNVVVYNPPAIPPLAIRTTAILSIGGGYLSNFFGLCARWTDDFTSTLVPTSLFYWQPSYINKPEVILDRFSDWDIAGSRGAKFWQGFVLHADTSNQLKGLVIRDADTLLTHPYTPGIVHNGESLKAYSFNTPFVAHSARLEPALDNVDWRFFDILWVTEPTPEMAETWQTQGTAFGLTGYMHVKMIAAAYTATSPVTLIITPYDGQAPSPITLPSTGGAYQKTLFMLTPNKGQLYTFKGVSSAPWQAYLNDWDIYVGGWGRTSPYLIYKSIGGVRGDEAKI